MQNENERAIVTKEDIVNALLLFLDLKFNEVKVQRDIEATIKKVEELGFLKKLKNVEDTYEIKSAIKSFVNAEFLGDLNEKLQTYKEAKQWS